MNSRLIFVLSLVISNISAQDRTVPGQFSPIPSVPPDLLKFNHRASTFELTDINGRTWRSADLLEHVSVVNLWATSCLPCRQEHPELQRFFDKTKSKGRLQVLTFSLDENSAQVKLYMRQHHYTFPVIIVGEEQADKLFPAAAHTDRGIPESWIIDRQGRRSEPFRTWTFGRILSAAEDLESSK
jgi:cytochrome oxidase Cu insertion factor (SCO1/SenC/PrrC family)